jgi:hypothetical protein
VASALANRDATRLQPLGAYAANLLGLTEQVPAKVVFLTYGPERRINIGRQEIALKNTTPRNMAAAGKMIGTVIGIFFPRNIQSGLTFFARIIAVKIGKLSSSGRFSLA